MLNIDTTKLSTDGLYPYTPNHALPAVFAGLVGLSLLIHIYQNFRYHFWRITFFMFWAGSVFTAGWIMRCISTYNRDNLNVYIAQYVLIYAGPPIYSAAEYNVLGRLMHYLPMHAPLHPHRLVIFFIYLGAAVESLTAAGAALIATNPGDVDTYRRGSTLISIALVLQGAVECLFMAMVGLIHHRCVRAGNLPRNVRKVCIMLYGTSTLILLRCIFRAVESFRMLDLTKQAPFGEWYLYVFEAAPMVLYTYWINIVHPGRLLPRQRNRYLDIDGKTERLGPCWIDKRSRWETFVDPFDLTGTLKGHASHEKFWMRPDEWPVACDGSFAQSTATNVGRGSLWLKK